MRFKQTRNANTQKKCIYQMAYKPGSVLRALRGRAWIAIHLGHVLPRGSSNQPGHANAWNPRQPYGCLPLFGLAPDGVCPATAVTSSAVRSYRTFSPLL
jgi:hypothetical protein